MMTEIKRTQAPRPRPSTQIRRELAEYRLGLICDDLCERWFAAWSDHKPLPEIRPFIKQVMSAGYRLLPLGAANNYSDGLPS